LKERSILQSFLGGDRFLGWFGKPPEHLKDVITTEPYITSIMEKCYQLGVRGFSNRSQALHIRK